METADKLKSFRVATLTFTFMTIGLFLLLTFLLVPEFSNASGGGKILDAQIGYTGESAVSQVAAYGEQGRKYYLSLIQTTDLIFPLSYALWFVFGVLWLVELLGLQSRASVLLVLPAVLAALFDYSENFAIRSLLTSYPASSVRTGALANVFGTLKFASIVIEIAIAGTLAVMFAVKSLRKAK